MPATMDGLADGAPLVITREVFLDVSFVLAARPGTALAGVRSVASHPHALAQTAGRLAELFPDVVPLPVSSTAGPPRPSRQGTSTPPCAPRSRPSGTGWRRWSRTSPTTPAQSPASCSWSRRVRCRPPRATTRPRWWPSSATAPARCSRC
ncbi:prephenate dehydratase domain-containing protein [Blastococcus brunescens]|uniref:Prephenate dehydratase domain-containing protein n=1 Tax=Blastococcus brunescens TaxID=1564165 RepID=A0ABZ1AZX6_9ACTN|nr:prephenate dehydratase domain-containing protein [Blastococcus sp. BMG 8361]WRL64104.1 prephenate dehydratase domain-containing protein [Blastococcus sp. BMG 8361]